ncbi:2Fe-2S iron-sulfur cluster-binding protein [Flavisphingomonas formosensis]|uniref:2Fe-2S iron-sulfur cluster-binding protein n=1 Tax=Flavisphingomonas formosensis TaxID=861534 RepID=UPI0012F9420A|nr:2Fe-2S iron-sulfur cluster-binding protein [Sphingomonas formosensis]
MSGFRLNRGGSDIDRGRPLAFRFNGRLLHGFAGDTLASALIANGVSIVARSFKYHRPRGIVGSGFAETNALVQLGSGDRLVPNMPATLVPLAEGLEASSPNSWPSVDFDLGRVNDRVRALLSAGFYYKSFMWPGWHLFEGFIRRAAGIGRAPALPDPDRYEAREIRVDRLVIGAGRAGREAAERAVAAGEHVLILDAALDGSVAHLGRHPLDTGHEGGCLALARTTALGLYDHGFVTAVEEIEAAGLRQRLWKIRAQAITLATGAFEQPLIFANNDLPGILLASAWQDYLQRHAAAPGRTLLVATTTDNGYAAAFAAQDAGLTVRAIVDRREAATDAAQEAERRSIAVHRGAAVIAAHGSRRVRAATIATPSGTIRIACHSIAMSGGWAPARQLFNQPGCMPERCELVGMAAETVSAEPLDLALTRDPKTSFIDFQTDVTLADMALATRENYRSVEHVKRYTVWGMGTDQGKLSAANGAAALAALQDSASHRIGATRNRPPFAPVAIATLAASRHNGALHRPWRHLPAHGWHEAHGAVFEDFGWLRPSHYPLPGEDIAAAARREAAAVRNGVGIMDSSSLGKIELKGPDAGRFLDLLSAGRPSTIAVGDIRYNLLLTELGTVLDDGVVTRLGPDHFLLNTSSSHTETVMRWIEDWHQCQWPFDFVTRNVTEEWAALTIAGPQARALLASLPGTIDLAPERFPHLAVREGVLTDHPVRIMRVSFTGERSYEINVPAPLAVEMADRLWRAGTDFGLVPFGLDALEILRIEKGYIVIGTDTDGESQPGDIGFRKMGQTPGDFLGKRSLMRASASGSDRQHLVGLMPSDPAHVPLVGAHILQQAGGKAQGFVTSSCFSPTLGRGIALALMKGGQRRHGEKVTLWSEGLSWQAEVTMPRFVDPKGERLHG